MTNLNPTPPASLSPQTNAQNALLRAEQFAEAGDPDAALRLLDPVDPRLLQGVLAGKRLFLMGRSYLELKQPELAIEPLAQAVNLQKSNPNYRIAYGAALHLMGRLAEAEKNYREAIRLAPTAENPPFNLGKVLADQGNIDGAKRAYQLAISRNPRYTMAMVALAEMMIAHAELNAANEWLQKALAIEPKLAQAWNALGKLVERTGKFANAGTHYQKAVDCEASFAEGWYNLGRMKGHEKDLASASDCLSRALNLEPQNEQYRFMRGVFDSTAVSDEAAASDQRVPDSYVKQIFDQYADTFDKNLVEDLAYNTPTLLCDMLMPFITNTTTAVDDPKRPGDHSALDLGCGTGLIGGLIAKECASLVGVDLSPKMLEKAKARGYSSLVVAEIGAFLAQAAPRSYDLVIAADVFVYIGNLASVFIETSRVTKAGGIFAFSVESLNAITLANSDANMPPAQSAGFKLLPSGRFAHKEAYIQELARQSAFEIRATANSVLRTEAGEPIWGTLFVLQRT